MGAATFPAGAEELNTIEYFLAYLSNGYTLGANAWRPRWRVALGGRRAGGRDRTRLAVRQVAHGEDVSQRHADLPLRQPLVARLLEQASRLGGSALADEPGRCRKQRVLR